MFKRGLSSWMFGVLLLLVIVACSPVGSATASAPTATASTDGATVESVPTTVMAQEGPVTGMAATDKVLAWVAPGAAPGRQSASNPGQVVFFTPDGETETVLQLPNGTTRVTQCGPESTSPDGSQFAFIATVTAGGVETGTIYMMRGVELQLHTVATGVNPVSCYGSAPFRFAPDGSRYAYVNWAADANNATSPRGRLLVFNSADHTQAGSFSDVANYTLTSSGAAFVSFFNNDRQEATEVGISVWDGSNDREVASLRADENCYYTSASVAEVAGGELAVVLGYRCSRGDTTTRWQLHVVDPANRTSQLELTEPAAGRYFGFSDTNSIYASVDGSAVFFTVPDGLSNQSVSVLATSIDNIAPTTVVQNYGLMSAVSDLPYDANNATAQLSPDNRFLAIVRNTPDNDATLLVVDLADPSTPPTTIDAGDRGDTVASMIFSADSSRLYFVAGADEGGNNSLFVLDLATGSESRVDRGRYAQMAVAPDGSLIAVMDWVVFNDNEPPYLTFKFLDPASGSETVVFVGGEVNAEGKLINPAFAYPLAWRRG